MTEPRDPSDPATHSNDAVPSATARLPWPADPAPPPVPPQAPAPPVDAAPKPAWTTPPPSPGWHPVRRSDDGRGPSIAFGLILLAVGLWFFGDLTLGLDLPTLRWSQLWPLIFIVIGVWVLFGARRRPR